MLPTLSIPVETSASRTRSIPAQFVGATVFNIRTLGPFSVAAFVGCLVATAGSVPLQINLSAPTEYQVVQRSSSREGRLNVAGAIGDGTENSFRPDWIEARLIPGDAKGTSLSGVPFFRTKSGFKFENAM